MSENRLERFVSVVLVVCAIAIAGSIVYRQLVPVQVPAQGLTISYLEDWQSLLPAGRQVFSPRSQVQMIEFVDLECPACGLFEKTVQKLSESYGPKLGLTLVHYPLPMHKSALNAARAAECGVPEGKFAALAHAILSDNDSLASNLWELFGERAGISDRLQFTACVADTMPIKKIADGIQAGDRILVRATPTVIVNGWRFSTTPTETELRATIEALLAGKKPPFRAIE